jgi:hypothetical protein
MHCIGGLADRWRWLNRRAGRPHRNETQRQDGRDEESGATYIKRDLQGQEQNKKSRESSLEMNGYLT